MLAGTRTRRTQIADLIPSLTLSITYRAGDAAHSFPPTGGLGLNSGIGDVHNLAYKLAAVHQGWGGENLIETYEQDRRQVALVNSQQSVKNGQKIFGLLKKLGTTDHDIATARENLARNLRDTAAMARIDNAIEDQREHFDNLGLHIGYIYGNTQIPPDASIYQPTCTRGARLPHAWIQPQAFDMNHLPPIDLSYVKELSADLVQQKQYSTLDLCGFRDFTIFTDSTRASIWEEHVQNMCHLLPATVTQSLSIRVVALGRDFELTPDESSQRWVETMRLKERQATLVRPDQHILDCFDSAKAGAMDLYQALNNHLGWPAS